MVKYFTNKNIHHLYGKKALGFCHSPVDFCAHSRSLPHTPAHSRSALRLLPLTPAPIHTHYPLTPHSLPLAAAHSCTWWCTNIYRKMTKTKYFTEVYSWSCFIATRSWHDVPNPLNTRHQALTTILAMETHWGPGVFGCSWLLECWLRCSVDYIRWGFVPVVRDSINHFPHRVFWDFYEAFCRCPLISLRRNDLTFELCLRSLHLRVPGCISVQSSLPAHVGLLH